MGIDFTRRIRTLGDILISTGHETDTMIENRPTSMRLKEAFALRNLKKIRTTIALPV